MGKLTDNIRKVSARNVTFNAGTVNEATLLLDIPRGYVARIMTLRLMIQNWQEDLEGLGGGEYTFAYNAAVTTNSEDLSTSIPHSVDHSVIGDIQGEVVYNNAAGQSSLETAGMFKFYDFAVSGMDVITPRDLQINVDAFGADNTVATEGRVRVEVEYKYEKVTNQDLLEILDIL